MKYYVTPSDSPDRYDLRQTRYKEQLAQGNEHPHDVIAQGFTVTGMLEIIEKWFKDSADTSALVGK